MRMRVPGSARGKDAELRQLPDVVAALAVERGPQWRRCRLLEQRLEPPPARRRHGRGARRNSGNGVGRLPPEEADGPCKRS